MPHNPYLEAFQKLLKLQGSKCAICRANLINAPLAARLDHTDGARPRGILCDDCFHLLRLAHDSLPTLRAAVCYLELHNAHQAANPAPGPAPGPAQQPTLFPDEPTQFCVGCRQNLPESLFILTANTCVTHWCRDCRKRQIEAMLPGPTRE